MFDCQKFVGAAQFYGVCCTCPNLKVLQYTEGGTHVIKCRVSACGQNGDDDE